MVCQKGIGQLNKACISPRSRSLVHSAPVSPHYNSEHRVLLVEDESVQGWFSGVGSTNMLCRRLAIACEQVSRAPSVE